MIYHDSLRLLALQAVMAPDGAARYRQICRWYSTTFHTPLHLVDELPEEDIMTAYYESTYEELSEEERQEALRGLLETEEERKKRQRQKDAEDAESFDFAQQIAAETRREEQKKKLSQLKEAPKTPSMFSYKDRLEAELPSESSLKLEPDVNIKFMDASEFERELEGFGTMAPPPKSPK